MDMSLKDKGKYCLAILLIVPAFGSLADSPFQGTWSSSIVDKKDNTRIWSESFSLIQHGSIVCGEWWSDNPSQVFSGYVSGVIDAGQLKAFSCGDNGQFSEDGCPRFFPEAHFFRKVKGGLRWVSGGLNPTTKPRILRREIRAVTMEGDERTRQLLIACKAGSNILLHSDAQSGTAHR